VPSVVASLRDLRRATESRRRGDYSAPVPDVATDETGALAQSCNTMIEGGADLAALEIAGHVPSQFAGRIDVGIGVNSGAVIAGTVGGGGRFEFTVIGDAVNTAARVEAATRETGDRVLITEDTRRRLRTEAFELDVRKTVELKGKQVQVELWAPRAHLSDGSNHGRAGASAAD
jgi:class 3 adenylate cyclase